MLDFLNVMDADGLESSHAISVEVANPTQITEIFDAISYTKGKFMLFSNRIRTNEFFLGSAVIRMMNLFLGENTFRQAVANYLNQK